MCRMMFAAILAGVALCPLSAQEVPGRDLFHFPIGTLAEAPALASAAGGGFWNPATIRLERDDRLRASVTALNTQEQGVSAQLGAISLQVRPGVVAGISVAQSSVADLVRTDTDPQSIGSDIEYRSTILSAIVAGVRGSATYGLALRRRSGTVDRERGRATSVDVGATIDRPRGLPFRAGLSTFLLSPSHAIERATVIGAAEGFLPFRTQDVRLGLSHQREESGGGESFAYVSGSSGRVDLRGGFARQTDYGNTTTRLRLGVGVRYAGYLVGVARDDGTAGLGASYQFMLTTVVPGVRP